MMTPPPKLLIVDDGQRYAEMAFQFMRGYRYATRCTLAGPCWTCPRHTGCQLTHAHDSTELDQALSRHDDIDVVLLDLSFDVPTERLLPSDEPDEDKQRRFQGLAILSYLRRRHPRLPVILMTSRNELPYEEAAAALDVDEYVTLAGSDAFDARAVELLIERVLARQVRTSDDRDYAWGDSAAMARLKRESLVLARTALPILMLGETGVGKSALAERVIHPASGREGPFLAVDLASLPSTLVASELFGTVKGAFSGATDRPGRFERAHGGTLFLDEIGNLPLDMQRLLLLALESGRITRLGENQSRPVDVRVIAATNIDLGAVTRTGGFRADLYARLNPSLPLRLPPLRERPNDLPDLVRHFTQRAFATGAHRRLLDDYAKAHGLATASPVELALGQPPEDLTGIVFAWSAAVMRNLREHVWPGNLRELDHVVVATSVFALADALHAALSKRSSNENPHWIPIPAKLLRDLLSTASLRAPASGPGRWVTWTPSPTLHAWVTDIETQLLQSLYKDTQGDFAAMAEQLLTGPTERNARRVRLRFNQLGLRARTSKRRSR